MTEATAVGITTVGDLLAVYQREYFPLKAPGTQKQQGYVFHVIMDTLGDLPLTAITPALLRTWRNYLGRTRQPGTVRQYMDTFSAALRIAVEDYALLASNPVRNVRKPPEPPGRVRFLSQDEKQRLLAACQASRQAALYPMVLVALSTGCRRSEVSRLRWSEVDMERAVLRLERTKNGTRRQVPLSPQAVAVLQRWQAAQGVNTPWVFPRPDGAGALRSERAWQGALQRAGLEDFHFHDLRHTTASYLAMSGASLAEIAEILGHKRIEVTRRYTHLTTAHTAAVVERMTAQFLQDGGLED